MQRLRSNRDASPANQYPHFPKLIPQRRPCPPMGVKSPYSMFLILEKGMTLLWAVGKQQHLILTQFLLIRTSLSSQIISFSDLLLLLFINSTYYFIRLNADATSFVNILTLAQFYFINKQRVKMSYYGGSNNRSMKVASKSYHYEDDEEPVKLAPKYKAVEKKNAYKPNIPPPMPQKSEVPVQYQGFYSPKKEARYYEDAEDIVYNPVSEYRELNEEQNYYSNPSSFAKKQAGPVKTIMQGQLTTVQKQPSKGDSEIIEQLLKQIENLNREVDRRDKQSKEGKKQQNRGNIDDAKMEMMKQQIQALNQTVSQLRKQLEKQMQGKAEMEKKMKEQEEIIKQFEKEKRMREENAENRGLCKICLIEIAVFININCGHICLCENCVKKWNKTCPICKLEGEFKLVFSSVIR